MKLFSSFSLASEKLSKYIIAIFGAKIMRIIKSAKRKFDGTDRMCRAKIYYQLIIIILFVISIVSFCTAFFTRDFTPIFNNPLKIKLGIIDLNSH